jgi:hypothetical protein
MPIKREKLALTVSIFIAVLMVCSVGGLVFGKTDFIGGLSSDHVGMTLLITSLVIFIGALKLSSSSWSSESSKAIQLRAGAKFWYIIAIQPALIPLTVLLGNMGGINVVEGSADVFWRVFGATQGRVLSVYISSGRRQNSRHYIMLKTSGV